MTTLVMVRSWLYPNSRMSARPLAGLLAVALLLELAVEDRHRADRVAQRRDRAVAGTDIGEAVLLGVGDRHVVERHRAGKSSGIGRDRDAIVLAGGIDIEIGDRERAVERAGNGDLAVEGDAVDAAVLDAVDGEGLAGDHHVFGVGAGRDLDGVAVSRCVDRGLDGGVAAVADEQDVVAAGAVDLLDAGERVGAFAAACRHHEVAGAVVGDARGVDRRGIRRGVDRRCRRSIVSLPPPPESVSLPALPVRSSWPSDPEKVSPVVPAGFGSRATLMTLLL